MQRLYSIRYQLALLIFWLAAFYSSSELSAQNQTSSARWNLREEFLFGSSRKNPNADREQLEVWYFLRTTQSAGPVESRQWLRDGKYATLLEGGEKLFGSPLDGWAFRINDALAPLIGKITSEYDVGLKYQTGDILLAPGPDHAIVIGWRSPVSGRLEIDGSFEHSQACCGDNSRIAWYIERGRAPNLLNGFQSTPLARGECDFGTDSQRSPFHIEDPSVQAGDFVYFIVDAFADGTATPHHGDATKLELSITVHDPVYPPPPSFEKDVFPILASKCQGCHGEEVQEAKLDLRTLSEILRGGENGPAIVRNQPQQSLLLDLAASGQMPPEADDKLADHEIAILRDWIKAGAPAEENIIPLPPHSQIDEEDRGFWAFRPPLKGLIPEPRSRERIRTVIDAFLLAKLEERGLQYSPEVDKTTLIRRAYFDLLGLPPEPKAVQAFLEDSRENAYEILIDELLKSPHYGERWGRHWLDAAGYVDGKLDNDLGTIYPNNGIWRYRDYVIASFNEDKPFDQFLTEQIAGDELIDWRNSKTYDSRTISLLTATGFLRNVDDHTDFPQYGIEKRYEVINETLDMFSTAVLGLTMECCRCHNHKYDPLPQRDYYRLMACFEPAFNVYDWKQPKDRHLPDVSLAEKMAIDQLNAEIDRQIAEVTQAESMLKQQVRDRLSVSRLEAIPEPIRNDVRNAVEMKPDQRNEIQKYLAEKFSGTFAISEVDLEAAFSETEKASLKAKADQRIVLASQKKSYSMIQALWDVGEPPLSHVHRRGNVRAKGVLVQAGFPEVLQPVSPTESAAPARAEGATSGRRLQLARWLTQPSHPLTARVLINRIWHHHFGRGIVETLGNFGRSGSLPTHPELLDWLAVDFMDNGWNIKRVHRQIMLSSAYRQSSRRSRSSDLENALSNQGEITDPENRLLWRMNMRRLESEIIRDSLLVVGGTLDRTAGGPPDPITNPADGLSEVKSDSITSKTNRRSLYLFARRVYPLKFLEIFDAPIMSVNCTQRTQSATVLQSLALLNSEFMYKQADSMSKHIVEHIGEDTTEQVMFAFLLAFARPPLDVELEKSRKFLESQSADYQSAAHSKEQSTQKSLADFCQMLISSNEFLYVE